MRFFSLFLAGVLLVVSDLARRRLSGAASLVCILELPSPGVLVSRVADPPFAFGLLVETVPSVGVVALFALGAIVRPCCSVPEATADVRVGSGLSNASQR